jgi:hypothetical protein
MDCASTSDTEIHTTIAAAQNWVRSLFIKPPAGNYMFSKKKC